MKEISLYIHIPFCKQNVFIVTFHLIQEKKGLEEEYVNALIKEIEDESS